MGSHDDDPDAEPDEKPAHRVRMARPFYLGVTEVTRGQFRKFVETVHYQTDAERDGKGSWGWNGEWGRFEPGSRYDWQHPGFEQTDNHPVVNVSWNDAVAFVRWLSKKEGRAYRLPTEAEWEYACRAGTATRYWCGDAAESLATVANVADGTAREKFAGWSTIAARDGYVFTAPVGHYRANPWELFDMHGNVWEWCSDGYGDSYYKDSPLVNPPGPRGFAGRVLRGGGWCFVARTCRSAYRHGLYPDYRNLDVGFRLAADAPGP
jgi:formylglycine-generating enzyme required for sulfatase activity